MGDKTSLAVGPIVAACGVPFGKMSGRGLGHTGGTLDKLESIPGFRVELTVDELVAQVREVGIAIIGQTGDLVPADKLLYALRDVTATVDNVSLIAASIMSKKIAGGAEAIVLDVKVGDGAFMKTLDDARVLAETMIELGRRAGRETVCVLTDMDQPLGRAVGNALEVREALDTVRGNGPEDFTELVLGACAHLLALSDLGVDEAEGRRLAEQAVADGSAAEVWSRWIAAQGGDPDEGALPVGAGRAGGRCAASGSRRAAGSDRRRRRRAASGRRASVEGGRDRPRGRRRLPSQARRRRRGQRRARRGACARRGVRCRRRRRSARGVRDRRRPSRRAPARPRCARVMPEGPEVETYRARLEPRLVGRTFSRVRVHDHRLTMPLEPAEVEAELTGERVAAVERRGKYLVIRFESGLALVVHLRMTGGFPDGPAHTSVPLSTSTTAPG